MNNILFADKFLSWVASFRYEKDAVSRLLAGYSAAIALADESCLDAAVRLGRDHAVGHGQFYEIVLQSYLFLGFPRMLEAGDHLARQFEDVHLAVKTEPISPAESKVWFDKGHDLYGRVYGDMHNVLRERVELIAPEAFRWMIIEGYGKVLSRPGLSVVDRELAIVACLLVENRPRQLHSHLKGALNVGAEPELIRRIIEDHKETAPSGYQTALALMDRINGLC